MLFRRIGPHQHRSVKGGHTFCCTRQGIARKAGSPIRWSAFKDDTLLKNDCATLAEAKKLCRASGTRVRDSIAAGKSVFPVATADDHPWQNSWQPSDSCERDG